MTDFDTYAQIHSDEFAFKRTYPYIDDPDCDRMDSQVLEANDPPAAPDIYVFPNSIVAYNLRNKKWSKCRYRRRHDCEVMRTD